MKKMSQVLRETTINQIQCSLIKFDSENNIIGKCALGVLACESGDTDLKLSINQTAVPYYRIVKAYDTGLDNELPYLSARSLNLQFNHKVYHGVDDYIYRLNDAGLTFEQIADFLETNLGL